MPHECEWEHGPKPPKLGSKESRVELKKEELTVVIRARRRGVRSRRSVRHVGQIHIIRHRIGWCLYRLFGGPGRPLGVLSIGDFKCFAGRWLLHFLIVGLGRGISTWSRGGCRDGVVTGEANAASTGFWVSVAMD